MFLKSWNVCSPLVMKVKEMSVINFNYFKLGYSSIVFYIKRKVRQMKDSHQVFSSRKYIVKRTVPLSCNEYCFVRCFTILILSYFSKLWILFQMQHWGWSNDIVFALYNQRLLFKAYPICLYSLLTYEKGLQWIFFLLSVYLYVFYKKWIAQKQFFYWYK